MYPVLFKVLVFEARSYYLLWAFALLFFLYMSYNRAVKKYHTDPADTMNCLLWIYFTAILSAFLGVAIEKFPLVMTGQRPVSILYSGGSSACAGIFFGGIIGLYKLRAEKIAVEKFADAVALPLAMMLCIGRFGCFCEGCCQGKIIPLSWYSLHFPYDQPGICHFPAQLAESLALAVISFILYKVEKKYKDRCRGALLFPLFLIMYGACRLLLDKYRMFPPERAFMIGKWLCITALAVGAVWLIHTLKMGKNTEYKEDLHSKI